VITCSDGTPERPETHHGTSPVSSSCADPMPSGWSDSPRDHEAKSRAAGTSRMSRRSYRYRVEGTLNSTPSAAIGGFEVSHVEDGRAVLVG
jgi:hypothetical protein